MERGGRCETCGYDNYNVLHVHHVTPKAEGGTDDGVNLRLLCPNCHMVTHHGYGTFGGSSR
ncbi:HNH endonuclease [Rubrivirga sp. IMCC45206]|uniref:HNH endonuclease n=1 Tax=Rubrivirga sp. IMCC45206 TaxID=3391614 RepID=UPI00398FE651